MNTHNRMHNHNFIHSATVNTNVSYLGNWGKRRQISFVQKSALMPWPKFYPECRVKYENDGTAIVTFFLEDFAGDKEPRSLDEVAEFVLQPLPDGQSEVWAYCFQDDYLPEFTRLLEKFGERVYGYKADLDVVLAQYGVPVSTTVEVTNDDIPPETSKHGGARRKREDDIRSRTVATVVRWLVETGKARSISTALDMVKNYMTEKTYRAYRDGNHLYDEGSLPYPGNPSFEELYHDIVRGEF